MIAGILLAVLAVTVFSRGVIELYGSKDAGYAAGVLGLGLFVLTAFLLLLYRRRRLKLPGGLAATFALLYTVMALLSVFATSLTGGPVLLGVLYTMLHLFLVWSMLLLARNPSIDTRTLLYPIVAAGAVVALTGFLEFAGYVKFPGSWTLGDFDRIAGSLGSKQHYSFASATLGMLLVWLYLRLRIRVLLLLALALVGLCFVSLSRNGFPIVIGTLLLFFAADIRQFVVRAWGLLILGVIGLVVLSQVMPDLTQLISDRLVSISSFQDASNSQRLVAWRTGLEHILDGALLVGTETGLYSQAGDRLGLVDSSHFESAILQQFANYGLIGGFAFIGFFVSFVLAIRDRYLRALATMVFLSFIYYPGSEALPFVAIWLFIAVGAGAERGRATAPAGRRRPAEPGRERPDVSNPPGQAAVSGR